MLKWKRGTSECLFVSSSQSDSFTNVSVVSLIDYRAVKFKHILPHTDWSWSCDSFITSEMFLVVNQSDQIEACKSYGWGIELKPATLMKTEWYKPAGNLRAFLISFF